MKHLFQKTTLRALALTLFVGIAAESSAQTTENQNPTAAPREVVSAGIGIGYEYCGTGVGLTFYPHRNIGVFANGGIFFAGPSYMVGLKARYITSSSIDPYLSVHYGYSGCVAVTDEDGRFDSSKSKVFKHPNVGLGIDIHTRTIISMTLGLSTSLAHSDIVDYKHELEADGYDFGNSIILPVGITFGLKWRLR